MLLADTGATVLRIDWPAAQYILTLCGRRTLALDLKQPPARGLALPPVGEADALTEAFRPGVAERLGLGPADCLACNPRLAYEAHDGLGAGGVVRARRARSQLHRADRRAASYRMQGPPPLPPSTLIVDSAALPDYDCRNASMGAMSRWSPAPAPLKVRHAAPLPEARSCSSKKPPSIDSARRRRPIRNVSCRPCNIALCCHASAE